MTDTYSYAGVSLQEDFPSCDALTGDCLLCVDRSLFFDHKDREWSSLWVVGFAFTDLQYLKTSTAIARAVRDECHNVRSQNLVYDIIVLYYEEVHTYQVVKLNHLKNKNRCIFKYAL